MMTCSSPDDCAEIERRHATGVGLLVDGGASRGNLLSGEADAAILTVSRTEAEKKANPGYRAFLANGFNVTRALVLFFWEIVLEVIASTRAIRRDVRPRGHRGGIYPLMRGAMCVLIRDLVIYSVLTDMMRGRPAVYATFASYDEVAHHSGLMRADTLEALRKLDQQFGRLERARRYAPRPYEIVVLSDHGQTQGATFKQRNGYGLDELVARSLGSGQVTGVAGGDEQDAMVKHAMGEATGRTTEKKPKNDVSGRDVVVLGSGNLGLVYLMEEKRRLTIEEIEERHPDLLPALREHPHVGWLLVRSATHGAVVLGGGGARYLEDDRVEGDDPLAHFSPTAAQHLRRTDTFPHVADIMVGSFYDPSLDEACAFEELISFHGGLGGPQTRGFLLHPPHLAVPEQVIGAEAVHAVLTGWRLELQSPPELGAPAGTAVREISPNA
jgi:Type I phosphodiesterase / nucleotide pyrophosphatase